MGNVFFKIKLLILKTKSKIEQSVFYLIDLLVSVFGFQLVPINNSDSINYRLKAFLLLLMPIATMHELVRFGARNDGGYLIPDDLDDIRYCFSPGVSDTSEFEFDLISRGIHCYLADGTIDKPNLDCGFDFIKKNLDVYDSSNTTKLSSWIENYNNDSEMILQMDIEGHEYKILLDTPIDVLRKFRIIVIELHDLEKLGNDLIYDLIYSSIKKLTESFTPVHLHANNYSKGRKIGNYKLPYFFEVTLLRNDRLENLDLPRVFSDLPHSLDQKNVEKRVDYNISELVRIVLNR